MKFSGLILVFLMTVSSSLTWAGRIVTDKAHEICGPETKQYVADEARKGIKLSLDQILDYYQNCVNEEDAPSYRERCGDRPGGAYDNCTN